jgi:hypothetical protein
MRARINSGVYYYDAAPNNSFNPIALSVSLINILQLQLACELTAA